MKIFKQNEYLGDQYNIVNNTIVLTYIKEMRICWEDDNNSIKKIIKESDDVNCLDRIVLTDCLENAVISLTTLDIACMKGRLSIVKFLCSLPPDKSVRPWKNCNISLRLAVEGGNYGIVKYLCSLPIFRGVNASIGNNEPLIIACKIGRLDIVKYLCSLPKERGVNPAARDNEPLIIAFKTKNMPLSKYLLSLPRNRGINPSARDNKLLLMVSENGDIKLLTLLTSISRRRRKYLYKDMKMAIWLATLGDNRKVKEHLLSLRKRWKI